MSNPTPPSAPNSDTDTDARPKRIEWIARGVAQRGSHVLLCRDTKRGYFYLPGGHVEPGERAPEALTREFLEETGLDATPGPLLAVAEHLFEQRGKPRHEVNAVFHVEHLGIEEGEDVPSLEPGLEFRWVDLASLADIDLRPSALKAWLMAAAGSADAGGVEWISHRE